MHELWICRQILDIAKQHAADKQYKSIKKICLEVGELAAISCEALLFSFEVVATTSTITREAILEIISIKGQATCHSCQRTIKINRYSDACESCGNFSLTIIHGEELRLKSMEVE